MSADFNLPFAIPLKSAILTSDVEVWSVRRQQSMLTPASISLEEAAIVSSPSVGQTRAVAWVALTTCRSRLVVDVDPVSSPSYDSVALTFISKEQRAQSPHKRQLRPFGFGSDKLFYDKGRIGIALCVFPTTLASPWPCLGAQPRSTLRMNYITHCSFITCNDTATRHSVLSPNVSLLSLCICGTHSTYTGWALGHPAIGTALIGTVCIITTVPFLFLCNSRFEFLRLKDPGVVNPFW